MNYAVVWTYDGCLDEEAIEKPYFKGSKEECLEYMREMKKKKSFWKKANTGKWGIDLLNTETQRFVSYIL